MHVLIYSVISDIGAPVNSIIFWLNREIAPNFAWKLGLTADAPKVRRGFAGEMILRGRKKSRKKNQRCFFGIFFSG